MTRTMVWLMPDESSRGRLVPIMAALRAQEAHTLPAFAPHITLASGPAEADSIDAAVQSLRAHAQGGAITLVPSGVEVPASTHASFSPWMSLYLGFDTPTEVRALQEASSVAFGLPMPDRAKPTHISLTYTRADVAQRRAWLASSDVASATRAPLHFDALRVLTYIPHEDLGETLRSWTMVREIPLES